MNKIKSILELIKFMLSQDVWIKCLLWTVLVVGQIVSLAYLAKYPIPTSDDVTYSQSAYSLLTEGKITCETVPPMGGFRESSIIQHGRILMAFKALVFRFGGTSLFTARIPSYLSGLGVLWFTYLIGLRFLNPVWSLGTTLALSMSHPFVFASHSARPDITCCLFFMGALNCIL